MKVRTFWSIIPLFALCVLVADAKPKEISINVEPVSTTRYEITIRFAGEPSGKTQVRLPGSWGGQEQLYKAVRDLSVQPSAAVIQNASGPGERTILHKPGEKLTVTYKLEQDFQGPLKNDIRYRPVTDPGWIHWIGNTVWVLPEWDDDENVNISMDWQQLPTTWTIANSFNVGSRKHKFATQFGKLRSAIFVAGDFRLKKTTVAGDPVHVAIRGEWQFADKDLSEEIRRVIDAERRFWDDHSQDYYLVTLVPISEAPNALSFGGTGLHNSFALFATPNASIPRLRSVLAHEYAHNWIPTKLGRLSQPEQSMYWFSEGFTEYYTYQLMFRGGLISKDELVDQYNALIREYYLSPVRSEPNERIVSDFWKDPQVQRMAYLRGLMIAMNWNAAIDAATAGEHSLDDVMLDLFRSARSGTQELTIGLISEKISGFMKKNISEEIAKQVVNGEPLMPAVGALGPDVDLLTESFPVFDLGFDLNELRTKRTFAGVLEGSNAYAAGLRNGQTLAGALSIALGDTSKPIELRVRDGEAERSVKYLPLAARSAQIPQYKVRPKA